MKPPHPFSFAHRLLAGALALVLCAPACVVAQTSSSAAQTSQTAANGASNAQTNAQDTNSAQNLPETPAPSDPRLGTSESAMPDPSRGPQKPVQQKNATAPANTPATPAGNPANPPANQTVTQQKPATPASAYQEPSGTAAAQRGATDGGAASRPAGTAIAPAKQHRVRSLVVKWGAVAAGAAALGTVYALSRGTPGTPPGTASSTASTTHASRR